MTTPTTNDPAVAGNITATTADDAHRIAEARLDAIMELTRATKTLGMTVGHISLAPDGAAMLAQGPLVGVVEPGLSSTKQEKMLALCGAYNDLESRKHAEFFASARQIIPELVEAVRAERAALVKQATTDATIASLADSLVYFCSHIFGLPAPDAEAVFRILQRRAAPETAPKMALLAAYTPTEHTGVILSAWCNPETCTKDDAFTFNDQLSAWLGVLEYSILEMPPAGGLWVWEGVIALLSDDEMGGPYGGDSHKAVGTWRRATTRDALWLYPVTRADQVTDPNAETPLANEPQ